MELISGDDYQDLKFTLSIISKGLSAEKYREIEFTLEEKIILRDKIKETYKLRENDKKVIPSLEAFYSFFEIYGINPNDVNRVCREKDLRIWFIREREKSFLI